MWSYWFSRFRCLLTGHPGVVREWEWLGTDPQWKERHDAWMCIRCGKEFLAIPPNTTSYISARPHMDSRLVDYVNHAIDEHGIASVRVRATGDLSELQPRSIDRT